MYSLIGKIYGGIINRRNKKFDAGKGVEHVNVPVISVGNITLGGTGKT
ncbi:MAG: tetraacyldisaccharide 4'-kinase, partial [Candidatus Kapabacteria bacterium]|nr:tetraacyldisaccharide 4'-kinase [Candidatus Kapabacteria bacterium]